MSKSQDLLKKLEELDTNYYDFYICDRGTEVTLDGEYTIEQLELILELLILYRKQGHF